MNVLVTKMALTDPGCLFLSSLWIFTALNSRCSNHKPDVLTFSHKTAKLVSKISSTLNSYNPTLLWLFDYHGQLQTIFPSICRKIHTYLFQKVRFKRELFKISDGGTIGLDWAFMPKKESSVAAVTKNRLAIIMHGLCGDSSSEYITHVCELLVERGYEVVVIVARGSGGLEVTTHSMFTAARVTDMREAIDHIHALHPDKQLYGISYSLGAGLMLNYLGKKHAEEGEERPYRLAGAVCVSPPWDFFVHTPVFPFWSMIMVWGLKSFYYTNQKMFLPPASAEGVDACRNIREFDELVMPMHGYTNVDDYYVDASAALSKRAIATPTLAIIARDDPCCASHGAPAHADHPLCELKADNGLVTVTTNLGGHLGFAEYWPFVNSWIDGVIIHWFDAIAADDSSCGI